MISKLLVGLDGSSLAESVLPYAAAIARAGNVPLVLMRVIPPDHPSELSRENPQLLPFMVVMPNVELASTEDEAARHARQDARQYLDEVARKLEQQGVVVETAVDLRQRRGKRGCAQSHPGLPCPSLESR